MNDEKGQRTQAVPASDELLRLIVEGSTDFAIFTIDAEGTVTSWNIGAERLLGWTDSEILGRGSDVTYTPEDRAASVPQAARRDALAKGRAED